MNPKVLTYIMSCALSLVNGIINFIEFKKRIEALQSGNREPTTEEWAQVATEAQKIHERIQSQ